MEFGFDKQVIKPKIKGIDLKKLLSNNNVIYSDKGITLPIEDYESNKIIKVHHISITDGVKFNKLTIGVNGIDKRALLFVYLDIGVGKEKGNNLIPYNISLLKDHIKEVLDYIENQYGIKLGNEEMKGEQMEINVTIELDSNFKEYSYLLHFVVLLAPKKYNKRLFIDKENIKTSIVLANYSIQKKVYDKTKEIRVKTNIKLNKDYMRIEDTLKHQNKIADVFGTNDVYKLSDEDVKEYLIKSITKDIIKGLSH